MIPGSSQGTELIAATTTKTGLAVRCQLDTAEYPKGIVVSDARDGRHQHQAPCVPRRMELHYLAKYPSSKSRVNFITSPKRRPGATTELVQLLAGPADAVARDARWTRSVRKEVEQCDWHEPRYRQR